MVGEGYLGEGDDEVGGQGAASFLGEGAEEKVQGANAALVQLEGKRLEADAEEGRQRSGGHPGSDLLGGADGVVIFFGVGTEAEAVFEVDAKVFDRLTLEFLDDTSVEGAGQLIVAGEGEDPGEGGKVGGELLERAEGRAAQPPGRVPAEEVGAPIDGMDGLAPAGFSRVAFGKRRLGFAEPSG